MKFNYVTRTLALLALLILPGLGEAQETTWIVQHDRGWIGITVGYTTAIVGGNEQTVVKIESVEENSPAQRAGIMPGDAITHLNGRRVSLKAFNSLTETLSPGDSLPISLLRAGRAREVTIVAGSWPAQGKVSRSPEYREIVLRMDTIQKAIIDELDQMRLRIGELHVDSAPGHMTLSIVRQVPAEDEREMTFTYQMFGPGLDTLAFFSRDLHFAPDFPIPFEALFLQSDEILRVREEQLKVREALNDVRRMENMRRNELRASDPRLTVEVLERDERVRELRAKGDELLEEQEALSQRLREVSEEEMGRRAAEMQGQQEAAWAQARAAQEQNQMLFREDLRAAEAAEAGYTYTRFVEAGRGLVAGAQLEPLNPSLRSLVGVMSLRSGKAQSSSSMTVPWRAFMAGSISMRRRLTG